MATHGYGLRSKTRGAAGPRSSAKDAPAISRFSEDDVLLRVTSDHRGGLLSTRSAPKKVKAMSGQAIPATCDFNPLSLSDLTDLEELETPSPNKPQSSSKKRRR